MSDNLGGQRKSEVSPAGQASDLYLQLVKDMTLAEESRKASLEQRGSWIASLATALTGALPAPCRRSSCSFFLRRLAWHVVGRRLTVT
jgi:hypothetical protein